MKKLEKKIITKAIAKNSLMYGKKISNPIKIVICNNEKEWKKESKYYYFEFSIGTVLRDGTLVIKSKNFANLSNKIFENLVIHEMNHVFWIQFYKQCKPVWLFEGIATITASTNDISKAELKRLIKKYEVNHKFLDYRYLWRKFNNHELVVMKYNLWKNFILFITNRKIKKIIDFMDLYINNPTKENYKIVFNKMFKEKEEDLFNKFLQSL